MFLDGYAGTGAVGIEALSRGASEVWFVERAAEAAKGIRSNLDALGLASACRVLNTDLDRALRVCRGESVAFDIVFLDPPYEDEGLYGRNLAALGSGGLLRDGGWIVVEHSRRLEMPDSSGGLRRFRTLAEGSSALTFYDSEDS
jgi:16S rRNA (guanine(966)-N(2))-methyltransferase RsmD